MRGKDFFCIITISLLLLTSPLYTGNEQTNYNDHVSPFNDQITSLPKNTTYASFKTVLSYLGVSGTAWAQGFNWLECRQFCRNTYPGWGRKVWKNRRSCMRICLRECKAMGVEPCATPAVDPSQPPVTRCTCGGECCTIREPDALNDECCGRGTGMEMCIRYEQNCCATDNFVSYCESKHDCCVVSGEGGTALDCCDEEYESCCKGSNDVMCCLKEQECCLGKDCCDSGELCTINDGCCDGSQACGFDSGNPNARECCWSGEVCCGDTECCDPDKCINGECRTQQCAEGRIVCNGECCPEGTQSCDPISGACSRCCAGETLCPDGVCCCLGWASCVGDWACTYNEYPPPPELLPCGPCREGPSCLLCK